MKRVTKLANKIAQRSGGTMTNPVTMGLEALREALDIAFPTLIVSTDHLEHQHEKEIARLASAFEGKSFLSVTHAYTPGIDGFLHFGSTPTSGLEAVQLQNNADGGVKRVMDDAIDHEQKVKNGGQLNVHLFIRAADPNVTVAGIVNYIQGEANVELGMVRMTQDKYIKRVTILAKDGAVRVENGKVHSCSGGKNCQ